MIVVERIVGEDLNLGTDQTTVTNPGGGSLQGTQISLTTFARVGPEGTAYSGEFLLGGTLGPLATFSNSYPDLEGGAELGDLVFLTLYPTTHGGVYPIVEPFPAHFCQAVISAPNEVTIQVFNPTSAAIALGQWVGFRFAVFRMR